MPEISLTIGFPDTHPDLIHPNVSFQIFNPNRSENLASLYPFLQPSVPNLHIVFLTRCWKFYYA